VCVCVCGRTVFNTVEEAGFTQSCVCVFFVPQAFARQILCEAASGWK